MPPGPSRYRDRMAESMSTDEAHGFLLEGTRTAKLATAFDDGDPHVMPVWFLLDGDQVILATGADTVKGRNLRRDPRVALVVDDERPPYSFVHIRGRATLSEDPDRLLYWATEIARRYMGDDLADEFGRRNAEPGELLVTITPHRMIAMRAVAE